jgi:hypothetical protein
VLSNTAPHPWTLAAFTAHLAQNHCLETLEFTMDAQKYKDTYEAVMAGRRPSEHDNLASLWEKLASAYLVPYAPREINIPAYVREHLLSQRLDSRPPRPEDLDEAIATVKDLMNDSLFLPFLESVSAPVPEPATTPDTVSSSSLSRSTGRSMLRMAKHKSTNSSSSSSSSVAQSSAFSPKFLPHLHHHGSGGHHHHLHLRSPSDSMSDSSASPEMPDRDLFSDDGAGSPMTMDPASPPMTPPTPDSPSSGGFQRVMAAHTNAWKKVKLGFKKKPKTSHMSFGEDMVMGDSSPIGPPLPFEGAPFDGAPYDGSSMYPLAPAPHRSPLPHFPYDR